MKDLYYILGTDSKATPNEIGAAFDKLAHKLRPDGRKDHFLDSHLQEITGAYQTLIDPVKRRKYDAAYRRNYQRRLYYFKIKHINIAVMLTLIMFTSVFGYYVIKIISPKKTAAVVAPVPVATVVHQLKHHKKHHITSVKLNNPVPKIAATVSNPIPAKIAPPKALPLKMIAVKQDTLPTHRVQPVPVIARQPQPVSPPADQTGSSGYTAAIRSNETGVVYLHQSADYTSAVLAKIPNHSQISVLEKNQNFYKITYEGQTGYVPKWTVPSH